MLAAASPATKESWLDAEKYSRGGRSVDLGILKSGRGSNLGAILRAVRARRCAASIHVESNRAAAAGQEPARNDEVATAVLAPSSFPDREKESPRAAEHRRHPLALERLARGELRSAGRRVLGGLP